MKVSKKRTAQLMVFAIALLLVLALSIGISSAFYQAKRQASGTVTMNQGIIIDYQGFGQATDGIWTKENATNFILFTETDAQPGQNIAVNASSIRANVDSVDFYARVKLGYEFYNGSTKLETLPESFKASDLITTSTSFFGANWVESQNDDGWYYYGTGTTLGKLTPSNAETAFVSLFADGAKFVIEGENFTGADEGQGGGFKIDETTSINEIKVTLTLETLQGSADAVAENWSITPILRVDISTLTNNTQIEDIVTIDPTLGDVYLTGNPVNPVEILIGSRAFAGCSDLGLNLSDASNATYIIANDAFESTATVKYGSTNIKDSITSTTGTYDNKQLIPGTRVYAYQPAAFSPTHSTNTTYGAYQYTDSQGTWYYDLINESGNTVTLSGSALSANTLASSSNVFAKIKYVDNNSALTTLTIPQYIQSPAGSVGCSVIILESYNGISNIIKNGINLKNVVIPNGVTSIGTNAFSGFAGLTSITISNSVTSIGNYAFYYCTGLTGTLTIPDGVTSIGSDAFSECWSLTSVIIGNGVTSIGERAFSLCQNLTSVTIVGNRETRIEDQAFIFCSKLTTMNIGEGLAVINWLPTTVTNVTISPNNTSLASDGKAIFYKSTAPIDCLVLANYISTETNYKIPSKLTLNGVDLNVTSIGLYAFSNRNITSITIPDSVTYINSSAFSDCSGLTEVNIDSSTIAGLSTSNSYLLTNATKVYVKTGLTVGSWITGSGFTKSTSDREGYDLYTKNN